MNRFDAIVVGAGAAGCVVARRLLDDGRRVLLVDVGPGEAPRSIASIDAVAALDEAAWQWPSLTADPGHGGAPIGYRQGRGLGGSTAINTLVATPGDRVDYERWAHDFGCRSWDWAAVEPWFDLVSDTMRTVPAELGPLASALEPIAADDGYGNGGISSQLDASGFLRASLLIGPSGRRSAFDAYLGDAPPSLAVRTNAPVERVLVDEGRATGVVLGDGSEIDAELVVLSAGALQSPRLLGNSGLVPAGLSRELEDHPSFTFTLSLRPEVRQSPDRDVAPISAVLRWPSGELAGVEGFRPGNDLMALVMDHVGVGVEGRRYGAVIVTLTDVASRGLLTAPQGSVADFSPGWLTEEADVRRLVTGVRRVASLLSHDALGVVVDEVFIDDVGTPLAALGPMSDVELGQWLQQHPGPVSHVGASAPLGNSANSPVAIDGGVRGCDGLYLIDGSVLPHLPNANLELPIMAVAERLSAELVRR